MKATIKLNSVYEKSAFATAISNGQAFVMSDISQTGNDVVLDTYHVQFVPVNLPATFAEPSIHDLFWKTVRRNLRDLDATVRTETMKMLAEKGWVNP